MQRGARYGKQQVHAQWPEKSLFSYYAIIAQQAHLGGQIASEELREL